MSANDTRTIGMRLRGVAAAALGSAAMATGAGLASAEGALPNACPVDGCEIRIVDAKRSGDELALTFEANYQPEMSKNHIHVWWGDTYTVQQVSNNAEPTYGVKQGDWHPTDEYPTYTTQSAVSTKVRNGSKTICVSAGDRNHDILDVTKLHCLDVSGLL